MMWPRTLAYDLGLRMCPRNGQVEP